ncbi:MAG: DNA replication/repair protein RecF [Woeseiaceae bacterium]|nr:DNA replication/repair protein RecF [Woeseiaceae bacterium]
MPIERFTADNFRCLEHVSFEPDPQYNLIYGANASGKTSLLEALAYLGRAKSFRGAPVTSLVRHGADSFVLHGRVAHDGVQHSLGMRNGREGLTVRIDGDPGGGAAEAAEILPVQVIDPDIHDLVSGGPEQRRRFLDGVAFHVEHGFLALWRRFRRALKQRNAALKAGAGVDAWTSEFLARATELDAARRHVLGISEPALEAQASELLGGEVRFEYRPGWSVDLSLEEAVRGSLERDQQQGSTQVGPHRGDIRLVYDDRQAKRLVSRGQQKLLGCSMILAATEIVQTALERPLLLLVDDPAAELDRDSLGRLTAGIAGLGSQVVVTSLEADTLRLPADPAVFHVEHGVLSPA